MNQTADSAPGKLPGIINWLGYLAIALLVILPLSVLTVRSGAWQQGLMLYAIACLGSAILLLLAVLFVLMPKFAQWRKDIIRRAFITVPGAVLLLSALGAREYPPIHDITTNLADPPSFILAVEQRGANSNSLETAPETLELQATAYPDLDTWQTDASYEATFDRAVQVARDMGWDIYREDRNSGVIEAVDTTALMAFKDDVVIRLRTNADGTLVDLRSVSRVGLSDLGANAARIRDFLQQMSQGQ